jgi:holo-[acyl-carrier protein] synthase
MRVFGVGVDIAHVPRFERCVARHGERFLRRAFHPQEIHEFHAKADTARAAFLASRYDVSFPHMIDG